MIFRLTNLTTPSGKLNINKLDLLPRQKFVYLSFLILIYFVPIEAINLEMHFECSIKYLILYFKRLYLSILQHL